jgi:hypothetical protein
LEQSAGVEGEDAEGCGEVEENPFHGWEVGGWWRGVKRAGFSEEQACCFIEADTEKNSGLGKRSPVASQIGTPWNQPCP